MYILDVLLNYSEMKSQIAQHLKIVKEFFPLKNLKHLIINITIMYHMKY